MRIKEDLDLSVLFDYGFIKIDKDDEDEDSILLNYDYKFEIGHSRRGQFYYLLIKELTRSVCIYASEPDGSGGVVGCPDVLVKMSLDGVISFN